MSASVLAAKTGSRCGTSRDRTCTMAPRKAPDRLDYLWRPMRQLIFVLFLALVGCGSAGSADSNDTSGSDTTGGDTTGSEPTGSEPTGGDTTGGDTARVPPEEGGCPEGGAPPVAGPDGPPENCEVLFEGCCFARGLDACAAAGCEADECVVAESYPGQISRCD